MARTRRSPDTTGPGVWPAALWKPENHRRVWFQEILQSLKQISEQNLTFYKKGNGPAERG